MSAQFQTAGRRNPIPHGGNRPLGILLSLLAGASLTITLFAGSFAPISPAEDSPRKASARADDLAAACRETADWVRRNLGDRCAVIVRVPFVISGDLSQGELDRRHRQTIYPAARAMAAEYFSTPPNEPITILLFGNEASYRHHAERLFGDRQVSRFGYYRPHLRTVMVNVSAGTGPLVHELTHALVAFDFPDVPDWFNEGLASLHEQCRTGDEASGLVGEVNWRLPVLQEAIRQDRLRSLESMLRAGDFHARHRRLNYAQARYFCLYMQRHGVLGEFYRRTRASRNDDPSGCRTVLEVFPGRAWGDLEADFRRFVMGLKEDRVVLSRKRL